MSDGTYEGSTAQTAAVRQATAIAMLQGYEVTPEHVALLDAIASGLLDADEVAATIVAEYARG